MSTCPSFNKVYYIDTNVILDSYKNVFKLSDNGENLIAFCETVLEELDSKKYGNDEINYNAREFNRLLADTEIVRVENGQMLIKTHDNIYFLILKESEKVENLQKNDLKIILTAKEYKDNLICEYNTFHIVSNDIIFRTYCVVNNLLDVEPLKNTNYNPNISYDYKYETLEKVFPDKDYYKKDEIEKFIENKLEDCTNVVLIIDNTGHPYYLVREDYTTFAKIGSRKRPKIKNISLRNMEQEIAYNILTNSKNDIVVLEGIAGTGKTLLALLAALELIDKNKAYSKITYIRKTIISGDSQDEIGFLPGSKMQKMLGYLYPLKDNIEFIITQKDRRKKKWTSGEMDQMIKQFEDSYNIEYEYMGHLRGRNLSGIIIIDECQNISVTNLITILSRITEGSKVFILGSIKQIDNPKLNKFNNALTYMLNQCGTYEPIQIQGVRLSKVERGKITQWIEHATQEK